ncbi:hypothetical protein V8E54_007630 [Elaphomyces granulatus]
MEAKQGSAMELRSLGHEVDHGKQPQFIPTVLQVPSSKGPLNSSQLWECMNDIKYLSRPADFLVGVFMDADRIEDSGGSKAVTNPGPGSQERQLVWIRRISHGNIHQPTTSLESAGYQVYPFFRSICTMMIYDDILIQMGNLLRTLVDRTKRDHTINPRSCSEWLTATVFGGAESHAWIGGAKGCRLVESDYVDFRESELVNVLESNPWSYSNRI